VLGYMECVDTLRPVGLSTKYCDRAVWEDVVSAGIMARTGSAGVVSGFSRT
jgi:hypothetical protein